jgi:putative redox protein
MSTKSETETPKGFRQVIHVNGHTLHADVGQESGGQGGDPDPHDLFDSALAACKGLTVALYAKSRGMALDRVAIEVERDASRERQGSYVLRTKVEFFGALTDAEKQKLHEITTRCPIHKLMTQVKIEIDTAPLAV